MNTERVHELAFLSRAYKDLSQGEGNRNTSTDDIEKALNKLEGIILVTVNQLET